jgi:hypothetical protein
MATTFHSIPNPASLPTKAREVATQYIEAVNLLNVARQRVHDLESSQATQEAARADKEAHLAALRDGEAPPGRKAVAKLAEDLDVAVLDAEAREQLAREAQGPYVNAIQAMDLAAVDKDVDKATKVARERAQSLQADLADLHQRRAVASHLHLVHDSRGGLTRNHASGGQHPATQALREVVKLLEPPAERAPMAAGSYAPYDGGATGLPLHSSDLPASIIARADEPVGDLR